METITITTNEECVATLTFLLYMAAGTYYVAQSSFVLATYVFVCCFIWMLFVISRILHVLYRSLFVVLASFIWAIQLATLILVIRLSTETIRVDSPCGESSCSRYSTSSSIPYHPLGYANPDHPWYMFCPHPEECRWADLVTSDPPRSYPPLADNPYAPNVSAPACPTPSPTCLATTRPEDYPDLTHGLTNGYTIGVTATQRAACPGYDQTTQKGKNVCAICSHYIQIHYQIPIVDDGCASYEGEDYVCFLCEDYSASQTSLTVRIMNIPILCVLTLTSLALLITIMVKWIPNKYDGSDDEDDDHTTSPVFTTQPDPVRRRRKSTLNQHQSSKRLRKEEDDPETNV